MANLSSTFTVTDESSLLDFLAIQYPQSSKTSLKKMIVHGNIFLNGKTAKNPSVRVAKGDIVGYARHTMVTRSNAPFRLVFEDECLVIIEKPAGLLTYGEKGTSGTSAYKEMREYLSNASKSREELFVVHRLDREVSGLLMFARTEEVQEKLKENWQEFTKKYYALAEGIIKEKSGVLSSWLSDGPGYTVRSGAKREGAKYAETKFNVLKVLEDHTLLEMHLITGRKNQLRVHLADISHPIVGDRRYGADDTWERRIRLHACYLKFQHPKTGQWLEFQSDLPRGFLVLKPENEKYK